MTGMNGMLIAGTVGVLMIMNNNKTRQKRQANIAINGLLEKKKIGTKGDNITITNGKSKYLFPTIYGKNITITEKSNFETKSLFLHGGKIIIDGENKIGHMHIVEGEYIVIKGKNSGTLSIKGDEVIIEGKNVFNGLISLDIEAKNISIKGANSIKGIGEIKGDNITIEGRNEFGMGLFIEAKNINIIGSNSFEGQENLTGTQDFVPYFLEGENITINGRNSFKHNLKIRANNTTIIGANEFEKNLRIRGDKIFIPNREKIKGDLIFNGKIQSLES